jgi:hypothetical protein
MFDDGVLICLLTTVICELFSMFDAVCTPALSTWLIKNGSHESFPVRGRRDR